MTIISDLITEIRTQTEAKNPFYSHIPDVDMVCRGFKGLDRVVGNKKVKEKAVKQFRHILVIGVDRESKDFKQSAPMMNICMFGDPGTGKTTIANHLALIWAGSGYLEAPPNKKELEIPIRKSVALEENPYTALYLVYSIFSIFILATILFFLYDVAKKSKKDSFLICILACVGIFVFALLILIVLFCMTIPYAMASTTYLFTSPKKISETDPKVVSSEEGVVEKKRNAHIPEVVSVNKGTFTGVFLGETVKKTRDFMEKNRGNVIVFDEAYTLCENDHDSFGKDASAEIVRFLSENPRALIFILAGYEVDLRNGLFRIQKGMERRFLWKFYCEGYTPKQLYKIFYRHAADRGYVMNDDRIRELIMDNANVFHNYGGDCARLFDYSQQEYSELLLNGKTTQKVITYDMVFEGMKELQAINAKVLQNQKKPKNPFEALFEKK